MTDSESVRVAYGQGIPLSEAMWKLSTDGWKRAYRYAQKRDRAKSGAAYKEAMATMANASSAGIQKLPAPAPQAPGGPYILPPSLVRVRYRRTLATRKPDAATYERQMYAAIRSALLKSQYRAIGFEMPRKASDWPIEPPIDLFDSLSNFDWAASRIRGNGLVIEAVRLVHSSKLALRAAASTVPQITQPAKRSRGAQSRETEVVVAYNELRSGAQITLRDNYKTVWGKISALIEKRTGDPRKLAYPTVLPFLKKLHIPNP